VLLRMIGAMTESTPSPRKIVANHFSEHQLVVASLDEQLGDLVVTVANVLSEALKNGGVIYWCGNGGSASDSQHLAAELVGRFRKDRRPLGSVALSSDTSVLTCIANDFGYDKIFSRQIESLGHKGDVLVAISTSGNSMNVVEAVKSARQAGITTIGLLGGNGGMLSELVDHRIQIPSMFTARIQESHILIGHILCDLIEFNLGLAR
jgi:D-sedoheptulose 7-phosphate isomerase